MSDEKEIHYIDQELGRYRRHSNNIMGNAGREAAFNALNDLFITCAILKAQSPNTANRYLRGNLRSTEATDSIKMAKNITNS